MWYVALFSCVLTATWGLYLFYELPQYYMHSSKKRWVIRFICSAFLCIGVYDCLLIEHTRLDGGFGDINNMSYYMTGAVIAFVVHALFVTISRSNSIAWGLAISDLDKCLTKLMLLISGSLTYTDKNIPEKYKSVVSARLKTLGDTIKSMKVLSRDVDGAVGMCKSISKICLELKLFQIIDFSSSEAEDDLSLILSRYDEAASEFIERINAVNN